MAGNENVELVQALYEAYESRNIPGLLGLLHEDFELYVPEALPWGGNYKGAAGFGEFMQKFSAHLESIAAVDELIDAGSGTVIMVGHSRGTFTKTGERYEVRLADVARVKDGKLRSLDIYIDAPAILALLPR